MKPTQKKVRSTRAVKKVSPFLIAVIGLTLGGGAFAFAAGDMLGNGSLLAAMMTAFTDGTTVSMTRAANSPMGTIATAKNTTYLQPVAVLNLNSVNEKWWNTVDSVKVRISASGDDAALFGVDGVALNYNQCFAPNTTYGYGWKTKSTASTCISQDVPVKKVTRVSNNIFDVTFGTKIPVYPQHQWGYLTVRAIPAYTKAARDVKINTTVAVTARGSACRTVTYGLVKNGKTVNYGYTKCEATAATVSGTNTGNVLTVKNPYGYTTPATVRPICGLFRGGTSQGKNMIASPNPASSVADTDAACISYCTASGAKSGDMCIRGTNVIKTYGASAASFVVVPGSMTATVVKVGTGGDIGQYSISFKVTAGADSDIYIGRKATQLASASSTPTVAGGGITWSPTPGSTSGVVKANTPWSVTSPSSDTGDTSTAYRVAAGYSRTITLSVGVAAQTSGYAGIVLKGINYSTTNTLGPLYYTDGLISYATDNVYLAMHTASSTSASTTKK